MCVFVLGEFGLVVVCLDSFNRKTVRTTTKGPRTKNFSEEQGLEAPRAFPMSREELVVTGKAKMPPIFLFR